MNPANEEHIMRRAIQLLLAVSLSGLFALAQEPTKSKPQIADAQTSKATVYVYRYKQFVGSALAPSIYCDGAELARMENGRYFTANLEPGKHTFTSNDKQSGIDLDLKAGDEYFMRVELAAGFAKGHGRLVLVAREQGAYELKSDRLKPLDANKVANKDVVSLGEPHLGPTAVEESRK
jgi:Protein of unknown function (DUF2846)